MKSINTHKNKKVQIKGITRLSSRARVAQPGFHGIRTKVDFCEAQWIELIPYGLALGPLETRPVFLLRSEDEKSVLPIWLNHREASDALAGAHGTSHAPHRITQQILSSLQVTVDKCVFRELNGSVQIVDLYFGGDPKLEFLRTKIADCLSFCIQAKTKFYARKDFIESCRQIDAKVFQEFQQIDVNAFAKKRNHPYLM